ncbi:MAG: hypothetical protein L3J92_02925 [Thermoplasmata archaeon]|nr:hypothetical protein [Thermoplasmata archaeon]
MTSWSVRVDAPASFAEVLRTEEVLLRRGAPAIHVAVMEGTTVSYGVGVPESAPYLSSAHRHGIPATRRSSGGTGVLHLPGDLVWAVILPRSDPRVGRDFTRAYARLGAGLVTALAYHGVEATWEPAPGLSDEYCPLGSRGEVLAVGGRVVGAAAQHLSGTALLHQGTLSLDVDRDLVRDLFGFPDDSLAHHLASVAEFGVRAHPKALAEGVSEALVAALGPP